MTTSALVEQEAPPVQVTETSATAVAAREKAAVEARYVVAMNRQRNFDNARTRLLQRCRAPQFAAVAEYAKPIGGKKVRGASIRMMEEVARQYGNIDVQSQVTFDDRERRNIRVTATDLETNYSQSVDVILEKTVERREPKKGEEILGSRLNSQGIKVYRIVADEDQFLTKQNANIAKARRNMILSVVPGDLIDEALQVCADTRRDETAKDPAGARKRISDSFFALGVMPSQLCELLEKPSLEAVTDAEIELLRAHYTAIREGETTWAEIIEEKKAASGEKSDAKASTMRGTAGLKEKLTKKSDDNSDEAIAAQDARTAESEAK